MTYVNSDDEDLNGSGEIEGSASDTDFHNPPLTGDQHHGMARKYLIFYRTGFLLVKKFFTYIFPCLVFTLLREMMHQLNLTRFMKVV